MVDLCQIALRSQPSGGAELQARYLANDAIPVTVFLLAEKGQVQGDARVNLDEVSELTGVELVSEGSDTLGGFIYGQLGKVPAVGDTIELDTVRIEVLSVAGRRIKQVRLSRLASADTPGTGDRDEHKPTRDGLLSLF